MLSKEMQAWGSVMSVFSKCASKWGGRSTQDDFHHSCGSAQILPLPQTLYSGLISLCTLCFMFIYAQKIFRVNRLPDSGARCAGTTPSLAQPLQPLHSVFQFIHLGICL